MSSVRPKILITIDWFLPGIKSGGPVRSYKNMIDHLGAYYDFYIITRDSDLNSDTPYESVKSNEWNAYNAYTSIYYISKDKLNRDIIASLINEQQYDTIFVNGIYSFYFSILPVWLTRKKTNVIVSARGMLNPQAFTVKKTKKKLFLTFARILGLYKSVKFHATNMDEANHIKLMISKKANVAVAPNLPRKVFSTYKIPDFNSDIVSFISVARISIEKGTLNLIKAFQNIEKPVKLHLYGLIYDQAYWEKCLQYIDQLPEHIEIVHKGVVDSEDVPNTISQYNYFVLLSEGENFGHSILEGLSAGRPVIISDATPWRNLQEKNIGWDVNLKDSKKIDSIFDSAIHMSNQDYNSMSKSAYEFAKAFTEDEQLIVKNLKVFDA